MSKLDKAMVPKYGASKPGEYRPVLRGNITLEAAIIVPFMLVILMVMLLGALLIHDVLVLRTDNGLQADAYAIAGEDTRSGQSAKTFILKARRRTEIKEGWLKDSYTSALYGSEAIPVFDMAFEADDIRDYEVKDPKGFVRLMDFVDDATDLWQHSRDLKESIKEQVTSMKDLFYGNRD